MEPTVIAPTTARKWIAVPWRKLGAQTAYRKSWVEEGGLGKFSDTGEAYPEVGQNQAKGSAAGPDDPGDVHDCLLAGSPG
jgi:hypothetical protein